MVVRTLILDTIPEHREVLGSHMSLYCACSVRATPCRYAAAAFAHEFQPHLVLIGDNADRDVNPFLFAHEVLSEAKAVGVPYRPYVALLTGRKQPRPIMALCDEFGIDACVPKPIPAEALMKIVICARRYVESGRFACEC